MEKYYVCPMHKQEKCFCVRSFDNSSTNATSFLFPSHSRDIRHYFAGDTGDPCLGGRRYEGKNSVYCVDKKRIEMMLVELLKEEKHGDKSASFMAKRREELENILRLMQEEKYKKTESSALLVDSAPCLAGKESSGG